MKPHSTMESPCLVTSGYCPIAHVLSLTTERKASRLLRSPRSGSATSISFDSYGRPTEVSGSDVSWSIELVNMQGIDSQDKEDSDISDRKIQSAEIE